MPAQLRLIRSLLVAVLLITAPSAQAAAMVDLSQSSPWNMDYAEDSCRLIRTFGDGKDQVIFVLEQFDPVRAPEISLSGRRIGRFPMNTVPASITFGPGLPKGEAWDALLGTAGPDKTPIMILGPRDLLNRQSQAKGDTAKDGMMPPSAEQQAALTEAVVEAGSLKVRLLTGSLGAPLKAMRTCLDGLVKYWGLDPAQQAALSRPVRPLASPGTWLTSADYPGAAVAMGTSALIRFRIMVDATGKPASCHIQRATMNPDFMKLTCNLVMLRARFAPALDAAGQPIASYYTNSVRWLMP